MIQQDKQKSRPRNVLNNKMVRKCLKNLMHRLLHQYRSQCFDSNQILVQYRQQLLCIQQLCTSKSLQTKIENSSIIKQGSIIQKSQQSLYWKEEEYSQLISIWPQISVFIWEMARSPKWYVDMLKNQQIYAQENECIDMHVFTTKIYQKVTNEARKMTGYVNQFQDICADQIYFFLEEVSIQICGCFKTGQKIIISQLNLVTEVVQKSEIVTFYLLYKIFRDTSLKCRNKIISELEEGIFRIIQPQVLDSFAHYIIEKFQVLDMKMQEKKQATKKISITQKIMNSNRIKWREAIREDGQIGILIELQQEGEKGRCTNYMLMFDDDGELNLMSSSSINRQWKVCKKAQQNYDILNLVKSKKALAEKMRNTTSVPTQMTLLQNVGVLGGSMGKCLAQIDMYDDVGDFMVALSKRTIIGGSFNYLLMSVPLLGYLFMTGGFTYTFYYIFSNQYANGDKKIRELFNVTLGSATALGTGLLGATIGQSLIPVPVLGAFIGGLVGGFIGQLGTRTITSIIETSRFKQTIQQLKNTIQPKGYWNVDKKTLGILQIKKEKFYQTIPEKLQSRMNCDRVWITIIFFTLLCFYESRERIKAMQKKMKKSKQLEKKLSDYQIIEANESMKANKQYEPSIDFMCIIKYFEEERIVFIQYHEEVAFLLNKIFSKLK